MTIEEALKTFLTDVSDGDTSQSARQTARSAIASDIGLRVYFGRRPKGSTGPAITIRRVTGFHYNDLPGEDGTVQHLLDVNVWTRTGSVPPNKVCEIADNVRKAITQYRGTWGTVDVIGVTIDRDDVESPLPPRDASDDWTFAHSTGVRVTYRQEEVIAL